MNYQCVGRAAAFAIAIALSGMGAAQAESISQVSAPVSVSKGALNVASDSSPQNAVYVVTVRRGKSVSQLSMASLIGAVATSQVGVRGPETNCAFKSALGTSELRVQDGGDVSVTIVPAEVKDGAVATIVRASTSLASAPTGKLVAGCLLFAGHTSAEGWIDTATLHVGEEMQARFGDTHVTVRLTSLEN
ncbi:MAG: hypothetical protein VB131_02610 [Burkholderia gladioli]